MRGVPIQNLYLPDRLNLEINYETFYGCVSEMEAREAAIYCNYTLAEFDELPYSEKALSIAQYRLHNLIEAHVSYAANRRSHGRPNKVS